MATKISPPDLQGILIPAAQFSADNLIAKDDSTTPSAYTTAGARTGVPKATADTAMVIQGSGKQDEDGHIEIVCQRAGLPGLERGGFVWRDAATWASGSARTADTTSEYYGWEPPQLVTGIQPLDWATTNRDGTFLPDVIRLDNGTLGAFIGQNTANGALLFATYDPASSAWTSSNETPDSITHTVDVGCLIQLPRASGDANGRVLCFYGAASGDQIDMMYSDDLMVTWAVGARRILSAAVGAADMSQMKARHNNGQILMIVAWNNGGTETHDQFASVDGGASCLLVEANFQAAASPNEESNHPAIVPIEGGGFFVVTHKSTATAAFRHRRIGSAHAKLSDAAGTDIGPQGRASLTPGSAAFRGEDGALYVIPSGGSSTVGTFVRRSTDDGKTFANHGAALEYSDGWGTNTYLHTYAAEMIAGRVFLLARHVAPTSNFAGRSISIVELGGPSRMTAPAHQSASKFTDPQYASWAADNFVDGITATGLQGNVYLPFDEPDEIGSGPMWATTTTGGTDAIKASGDLELDTTAQTFYYTRTYITSDAGTPGADPVMAFVEFAVEIDAGDGDKAAEDISVRVKLTDGKSTSTTHAATAIREITIRLDSAGYEIWDEQAGPAAKVGATTTADFESRRHVRIALSLDGKVRSWHAVDKHARAWAAGTNATGLGTGGTGNEDSAIEWGHRSAVSAVSRWALVGFNFWTQRAMPSSSGSVAAAWTNPDDLHPQSFPTDPSLISGGARIRAVDGPALILDTWDVQARYDHSPDYWFSDKDPSPQRLPRTTGDNVAVDLVVQPDSAGSTSLFLSESVGVFVRGANFPDFTISRWDGAAWVTIATATGKLDGLKWARAGRFVTVDLGGGSGTAAQFIRWGDAVGGTFEFSSTVHRKIVAHSSGAWTDGTTARPVFELADIDDSEGTSGTAGELWFPEFGVVAHDYTATANIFRIQIQACHTRDDYYTGKFIVGSVHPFGWPHDRGWAMREEHDVDLTTRPGGLRTAVKRSPPRRTLQVAWVETSIDEMQLLKGIDASNLPDYVSANANPSAPRHSTISDVLGIIRQQSGPRDPIVFIRQIKQGAGSEQFIGSHLWIHGRIETTDPQVDNVLGREASDPMNKLNTILIVEEQ